jgi:hypothetical protein
MQLGEWSIITQVTFMIFFFSMDSSDMQSKVGRCTCSIVTQFTLPLSWSEVNSKSVFFHITLSGSGIVTQITIIPDAAVYIQEMCPQPVSVYTQFVAHMAGHRRWICFRLHFLECYWSSDENKLNGRLSEVPLRDNFNCTYVCHLTLYVLNSVFRHIFFNCVFYF